MAQYLVIREVVPGIRTYSCPFSRLGIGPMGGRSTAVRLSDNKNVLVLASTPLTDATRASVDELGAVKYIIGPDAEHHLFIKEWKAAYPDARVCGVQRTVDVSGVPVDGVWGRDANPLGDDSVVNADFASEFVPGHVNKEVVLLHRPSRTLIQADLMLNLPAHEQYSAPGAGSALGSFMNFLFSPKKLNYQNSWYHGMVWRFATDKKQFAHSIQVIDSWDFDRMIPCHGDVIETGAKAALRTCFKKFFDAIDAGKFDKYTPPAATATSTAEAAVPQPAHVPGTQPLEV
ncbi:hypothetical protein BKA62DRAFT_249053 [Auriculariales sp. MPI-PUGE-AT-0066]|nr:hypothetical protein BKA62DRAFT_249053 [Auriculariales sp. MPI-PUGE-AT-0066]